MYICNAGFSLDFFWWEWGCKIKGCRHRFGSASKVPTKHGGGGGGQDSSRRGLGVRWRASPPARSQLCITLQTLFSGCLLFWWQIKRTSTTTGLFCAHISTNIICLLLLEFMGFCIPSFCWTEFRPKKLSENRCYGWKVNFGLS